jgi:hypothetical protein
MVVLASKGGKVVFDGTGLLSPTDETAEILGNWVVGPLTIGPYNVGIGQSGHPTINHNPAAINSVIIGADASISGGYSVVVGSGSVSLGGSDVCIGNQATDQDGQGNKVIIGTCTGAGGGSIAIGTTCHADNHGIAVGINSESIDGYGYGAGIAIGSGASATSVSIAMGDGATASHGGYANIVIGLNAVTDGYGCCVMGANSSTGTQVNNGIAVGLGAQSIDWNTTAIGTGAIAGSASDQSTVDAVAIGHVASALSMSAIAMGPHSTAEGDSDIVIGNGAHTDDTNPSNDHNIAMGNGAFVLGGASSIALGDGAQVTGADGVALGSSSSVTGSNGIAIGQAATAGAGQIVFSSGFSGGAQLFKVVGSTPGNPDLFNFAVANLMGADTTALTLLIKKSDGSTIVSVPVTIGLNNSAGIGYAVLRVANT